MIRATTDGSARPASDNAAIARRLDELADLLEQQSANPFRVSAYRRAAGSLRALERPAAEVLAAEGLAGLDRIPAVGPAIARAIRDVIDTGRLPMLERLRGAADPVAALATVPGIGMELARRVHDGLGIDTLEELEMAAHDGSLALVPGFGAKRLAGVRDALAARLGRSRREAAPPDVRVPVDELLAIDREYRERARAGTLPTIAPRRFNPAARASLPVLHATRDGRHHTALFSNTARAHQLGRTQDWVVIYSDGDEREARCTVVTESRGPLAGRRVVRGREEECRAHYGVHAPAPRLWGAAGPRARPVSAG